MRADREDEDLLNRFIMMVRGWLSQKDDGVMSRFTHDPEIAGMLLRAEPKSFGEAEREALLGEAWIRGRQYLVSQITSHQIERLLTRWMHPNIRWVGRSVGRFESALDLTDPNESPPTIRVNGIANIILTQDAFKEAWLDTAELLLKRAAKHGSMRRDLIGRANKEASESGSVVRPAVSLQSRMIVAELEWIPEAINHMQERRKIDPLDTTLALSFVKKWGENRMVGLMNTGGNHEVLLERCMFNHIRQQVRELGGGQRLHLTSEIIRAEAAEVARKHRAEQKRVLDAAYQASMQTQQKEGEEP